jgi:hypothetical protein
MNLVKDQKEVKRNCFIFYNNIMYLDINQAIYWMKKTIKKHDIAKKWILKLKKNISNYIFFP